MLRRPVFALLFAPGLMGAGACETPYEETCTPVPEPPALTHFALVTDTLVIRDTSDFPFDTLRVELEPDHANFYMSLLARTPRGDYVGLGGDGFTGPSFLIYKGHTDLEGLTYYRVPDPGEYTIHSLSQQYVVERCINTYGMSRETSGNRVLYADGLAALGMDRRTLVLIHRLGGDSAPPPVTR